MTLREEDLLRLGVGTGHARKMVLRLPELFGGAPPPPARPRAHPSAPQPPTPAPSPAEAKSMPTRPVPRLPAAPRVPLA
jgi:hypothetical protein